MNPMIMAFGTLLNKRNLTESQLDAAVRLVKSGYKAGVYLGGVFSRLIDKGIDSLFSKCDHNE